MKIGKEQEHEVKMGQIFKYNGMYYMRIDDSVKKVFPQQNIGFCAVSLDTDNNPGYVCIFIPPPAYKMHIIGSMEAQ